MNEHKEPLTPEQHVQLSTSAALYAYGRYDAGERPWVRLSAFTKAVVAERANHGDLCDLYNRMLAEGTHVDDVPGADAR